MERSEKAFDWRDLAIIVVMAAVAFGAARSVAGLMLGSGEVVAERHSAR